MKRKLATDEINSVTDNETLISMVEEMENACDASLEILNDLLTYEKVDAGILVLDKRVSPAYAIVYQSLRPFILHVIFQLYIQLYICNILTNFL